MSKYADKGSRLRDVCRELLFVGLKSSAGDLEIDVRDRLWQSARMSEPDPPPTSGEYRQGIESGAASLSARLFDQARRDCAVVLAHCGVRLNDVDRDSVVHAALNVLEARWGLRYQGDRWHKLMLQRECVRAYVTEVCSVAIGSAVVSAAGDARRRARISLLVRLQLHGADIESGVDVPRLDPMEWRFVSEAGEDARERLLRVHYLVKEMARQEAELGTSRCVLEAVRRDCARDIGR